MLSGRFVLVAVLLAAACGGENKTGDGGQPQPGKASVKLTVRNVK